MRKRILINREDCEVRVAFLEDDELVEFHSEHVGRKSIVGNIYKGVVEDVKPGLQAAFIDCGLERNVFMHFMDVRAESLVLGDEDHENAMRAAAKEGVPGYIQRPGRRPRQDRSRGPQDPPIEPGDELIVQVVKEEIGGKAPRVSANIAIPGRCLVLLPFPSQQGGVSRKIATGEDRYRLKKLLSKIKEEDHSFIVRTAGISQPEEAIQADVEYLKHLWSMIVERYRSIDGPGLVYNEHEIVGRLLRDAFSLDVDEIVCDSAQDVEEVKASLGIYSSASSTQVSEYKGVVNIFDHHEVEKQLQRAMGRKVWLKSGGFLVIDENEALTAIDVNTGRFTGGKDQEKTSLRTNLEACKTIAQQIRLRDIGGIIVCDFIDMLSRDNQEQVSEELRRQLRKDRAKLTVGRIGDFGLMHLTRKRQKQSLKNTLFDGCPYCAGEGYVLRPDQLFRRLKYEIRQALAQSDKKPSAVVVTAHPQFAQSLEEKFRDYLDHLLAGTGVELLLRKDPDYHVEDYTVVPVIRPVPRQHRVVTARKENRVRPAIDSIERLPGFRQDEEFPVIAGVDPSEIPVAQATVVPLGAQSSARTVTGGAVSAADVQRSFLANFTPGPAVTPPGNPANAPIAREGRGSRRRRRGARDRDEQRPQHPAALPQGQFPRTAPERFDANREVVEDAIDDEEEDFLPPVSASPVGAESTGDSPSAQGADGNRKRRRGSRGGRRRRKLRERMAQNGQAGGPAAPEDDFAFDDESGEYTPVPSKAPVPPPKPAPTPAPAASAGPIRPPRPPRPARPEGSAPQPPPAAAPQPAPAAKTPTTPAPATPATPAPAAGGYQPGVIYIGKHTPAAAPAPKPVLPPIVMPAKPSTIIQQVYPPPRPQAATTVTAPPSAAPTPAPVVAAVIETPVPAASPAGRPQRPPRPARAAAPAPKPEPQPAAQLALPLETETKVESAPSTKRKTTRAKSPKAAPKPAKPVKAEKPAKVEKTPKVEKPAKAPKAAEKPAKAAKPAKPAKAEKTAKAPAKPVKAPAKPPKVEKPSKAPAKKSAAKPKK